jgi:hypothetical protein
VIAENSTVSLDMNNIRARMKDVLWNFRLDAASVVRRQLLRFGLDLVPVMDRKSDLEVIRRVLRESHMRLNGCESYNILSTVRGTVEKIEGTLAEVGVFRGGSAKLICEGKGSRELHLFDTFGGLPEPGEVDSSIFWRGQHKAAMEPVQQYLHRYSNVYFHKGRFPSTAAPVERKRFCFVHLDVDLYEATRAGLQFFYPRLNPGGVLISHDYNESGVRRAIEEFFRDKPEIVMQQPAGSQCFIVRCMV